MPGMLSENTTSSGPTAPTPPVTSPGAGAPPRDAAPGPEQPAPDVGALRDEAVKLVYGERFDKLIEMFQTNGPDKFARSMAIAVNTAISELEKRHGPLGPEMAAEVGSALFAMLLEDTLVRPKEDMKAVVEGVSAEQLQQVMPAILVMYADAHPDVSKEDVQAVMREIDGQVRGAGGAQQSGEADAGATAPGKPEGGSTASPPAGSLPQGGPK